MILLTNYLCLPILQKTVEDISERNESLECPVIDIVDNSDCQDVVETCTVRHKQNPATQQCLLQIRALKWNNSL